MFGPTGDILPSSTSTMSAENKQDRRAFVQLALLELNAGSRLEFLPDTGALIKSIDLNIEPGARMAGDFIDIQSVNIHLEPGSLLSASGKLRSPISPTIYDQALDTAEGGGHGSTGGSGQVAYKSSLMHYRS